jgi:hypothetical protein
MNILIIILGCHVAALLQDRIHTALALANHHSTDNIYFGFSGGIKYAESKESEARKMQKLVEPGEPYFNQWNYILDERSTNTAENFVYVLSLLEQEAFQKVYVVTSDFHAPRAQRIADGIIGPENPIEWIVAPLEFGDFRAMEQVHMRNVHNDINAALKLRELVVPL